MKNLQYKKTCNCNITLTASRPVGQCRRALCAVPRSDQYTDVYWLRDSRRQWREFHSRIHRRQLSPNSHYYFIPKHFRKPTWRESALLTSWACKKKNEALSANINCSTASCFVFLRMKPRPSSDSRYKSVMSSRKTTRGERTSYITSSIGYL